VIPPEVFEETLLQFFAPIRPYLDDPGVSDIMINGHEQIFVEKKGLLTLTPAKFSTKEALLAALRNAAQFVGKHLDEERPILEGRLPDGSRIEAVIPPAAPEGPCVSIRRFFKEKLTVERLVSFGALTPDAALTLQALVAGKANVMIGGGTGSGKTSMLNALGAFIPEGERVVIIEDNREVQLQRLHAVSLEARPPDPRGRGGVTIRDLFRATLRLRPDRIVVGEIRGGEALDIIQAMTSGHGGCLGTLHATFPKDTLSRLETMAMMSDVEMPLQALRIQIASGVNFIVQVNRLQDGSRKMTHIAEVTGINHETAEYYTQDIFHRVYHGVQPDGTIISDFVPTGILPNFLPHLKEHGCDLPPAVYEAARLAQSGRQGHGGPGHGHGGGHGHGPGGGLPSYG
jgi:pilus assembly protein CpaF